MNRHCDLMKHQHSYDALMNEINIYMCFPYECFLKYKALYEDKNYLYVLYEYFVGETLSGALSCGRKLDQTQIVLIIQQSLKAAKYLQKSELYHGLIMP